MSSTVRPWELSRGAKSQGTKSNATADPAATAEAAAATGLPAERPPSLADLEDDVRQSEIRGGTDVDGRLLWGVALIADGRFDDAETVLAPVLEHPDAPGRAHVMAAVATDGAGRSPSKAALTALGSALAAGIDGEIPALWMSAGRLMARAGMFDQAASAFDRAATGFAKVSDSPAMVLALREAIQVAAARLRFDEADALMRRARRFSPNDEVTLLLRLDEARLHALRGRWQETVEALQTALTVAEKTLSPDHWLIDHTLVSLAAALMERDGASPDVERMLERALGMRRARGPQTNPENTEVMLLLGEHHRLTGRLDDALPLIARAALAREANEESHTATAHAFLVWSKALEDSGQTEAAAEKKARAEDLVVEAGLG